MRQITYYGISVLMASAVALITQDRNYTKGKRLESRGI